MIKWLNYHHLLYFRIIATEGSIAKASEKLLVGQPALSSQLRQLEENLGQQLFERKNRSLVLTEAGKIALEYANEIFKKGEEFIQVFNEENLSLKSHYRIGVVDSVPKLVACRLVEQAQKFGNDCFISLVEGTPDELIQKVNSHKIDIVLSNDSATGQNIDILSRNVGKSSVYVYGAKKYIRYQENFPQSLNSLPVILPTKHSKLRYDIEHFFQENKIHYNLVAEVQDSSVKKLMGEHGKGLIFLPEFSVRSLVKEEKLFLIGKAKSIQEDYWLLSRKRTLKTPITDQLLKTFKV